MNEDCLYLVHISECIERIRHYTIEGRDAFFADTKTQDAVLRNLHTLCESTQRLSQSLKDRHPEVEWRSIAGFRNVVVHDYLGVDLQQVWSIVEHDLPELEDRIKAILAELGDCT